MLGIGIVVVVGGVVARAEAQPAQPAPSAEGVTAAAAARGAIAGKVVDDHGQPVAGATITFDGGGAITDADGAFAIADAPAGPHTLAVDAFGFASASVDVRAPAAGVTILLHGADAPGEEIIVVGSRTPEKRLDAPVTVEVVGAHDLATAAGPTYLSALSRVKGIDFSDAGLLDQRISARGFATQFNSRMLTMIDGRLAMLPGNGLPQGTLLPATSLDMKSVEVVVGPASALYGPNAHTGVINVVTKTPWDESGAAIVARAGSRGLAGGTARLAGLLGGGLGWKWNGEYLRGTDFAPDRATHTFGTTIAENDLVGSYDVHTAKTDGTLYYRTGEWQISGGASTSDTTGFSITNAGRNHLRGWGVTTEHLEVAGPHLYAQVTRTASGAGTSYQLDRLAKTVAAMGGLPADPGALDAIRDKLAFVDDSALIDSELQLRDEVGGVKLTGGGQARRYLPSSAGTYLDDKDRSIRIDEVGVYGQADAMLLDERLRLAAAARLDHHDLYGAQLSPKAAIAYEVAPEQKIRVGYNRAFKSPTVLENFLRINDVLLGNRTGFAIHDAAGGTLATIAPLVPEQVDALEVGYKGAFGDTLYVDAVAYDSWYHDFISPLTSLADPSKGTFATYADGTPTAMGTAQQGALSTYVNFGRAQIRGADLGVDVRPVARVSLSASASVLQLVSFSNDNPIEHDLKLNAPAYKLRGSIEVTDLGVAHTFVRVDARAHSAYAFESGYWSSMTLLGGDVPSRVVVDVSAGWAQPRGGWMISATVADLTNDHTPDVLGAPIPGRYGWLAIGYRYDGLDLR